MQFGTGSVVPMFYFPNVEAGQTLQTLAITAAQSISLSVSNVPASATQVIGVVDGGSIPSSQPVIATGAAGGGGQVSLSVGVPAGGPYRVRAIAVTGTAAILRSGQAGSISVPAGGSTAASITLQDVTATVGAATPASAAAGSTIPIQVVITDPGDSLQQPSTPGLHASFTPFTSNSSGTSSGSNSTTSLGGHQYQISIMVTLPATGGTWYYQVSTQAMQFVGNGVPTFYFPNVEAGQALQTLAITGGTAAVPVLSTLGLAICSALLLIAGMKASTRRSSS
jgi:hypothetical protein